jgi:hypothetical protein
VNSPAPYIAPLAERLIALGNHAVAGRPIGPASGWGMNHLFRRAGEASLCGETEWLRVVRPAVIDELTWICTRCQAAACMAFLRRGECPICEESLTAAERSPGGWRHCRGCRRGWLVTTTDGVDQVAGQNWPDRVAA